jgi:hypothetical protein
MRTFVCLTVLLLGGCTAVEQFQREGEGGAGGTPPSMGEDDFFAAPQDCPCVTLGPYEGISIYTDPDTPCPEGTTEGPTLHADFVQPPPHTCSSCTCSSAECPLPEGMHTNAAKCAEADGSPSLPFGPATLAEEVCSTEGALAPDLQCDGADCVQSLTVPALKVACDASVPMPSLPPVQWGRAVRRCAPAAPGSCGGGAACEPFAPEGALVCLHRHGISAGCPAGYTHLTFFEGADDTRGCDACTCGEPQGAACAALVHAYSDTTCSSLVGAVMSLLDQPGCVDLPSGTGLGSLEASFVADAPGTCAASGGTPVGGVAPAGPWTLCCKPATVVL